MAAPIRVQEYPPDEICIEIRNPATGQLRGRWGEDQWQAENVIGSIEIQKEMPGGDKSLGGELARDPQRIWDDLHPYDEIIARQKTGDTVFEGYLDETPDDSGDKIQITPEALGNQAILEDDSQLRIGFINGDASNFSDMSSGRRKQLLEAGYDLTAINVIQGFLDASGIPAGAFFEYGEYGARTELAELWFDGEGIDIGELHYDFEAVIPGGETSLRHNHGIIAKDELASLFVSSTDHHATNKIHEVVKNLTAGFKWALLQSSFAGAYEGESGGDTFGFSNLKVLGTQGLDLLGTWPNVGFSAKQMIEWLINNHGSPLKIEADSIEDDGFIIPQAWYGTPGSLATIIKDLVKYALYDWFVYKNKTLEYRRPGSYSRFWKTYVEESSLNETGLDSKRLWRSVTVQYQDVSGRTVLVGPPGSGSDVIRDGLEITDPQHPAVEAKRPRHALLDMKGVSNPEEAAAVGQRFLEEANLLPHAGSVTLSGYCLDSKSVLRPVAQLKAGDYLEVVNASGSGYRKIVNTTYTHDQRSCECDLEAPASGLEALLERLQVGLISRGVN